MILDGYHHSSVFITIEKLPIDVIALISYMDRVVHLLLDSNIDTDCENFILHCQAKWTGHSLPIKKLIRYPCELL